MSVHYRLSLPSKTLNNGIVVYTTTDGQHAPSVNYPSLESNKSPLITTLTLNDFKLLANKKTLRVISSHERATLHTPFNVSEKTSLSAKTDNAVQWYGCDSVREWVTKNECVVYPGKKYSINVRYKEHLSD